MDKNEDGYFNLKVLILGGAGYVASTLARLLIKRRFDVHLIDNYSTPSNITSVENIPIEVADIRADLDLSGYEVCFHLAAISGINRCNESSEEAYDTNVKGTLQVLSRLNKDCRVIFASTSAVYGEASSPTITEAHITVPLGVYGKTKLEGEELVRKHGSHCIFRFTNIYGRGLFNKRTVADIFIDNAVAKKPLTIHGDGRQRRDFVHLNDVLVAYWLAMRTTISGTYNIGGNEALSINDIAELVIKQYRNIYGYTVNKRYVAADCGRQWHDFIYSSYKAKQELGYEPSFSVNDEIRERLNAEAKKKA